MKLTDLYIKTATFDEDYIPPETSLLTPDVNKAIERGLIGTGLIGLGYLANEARKNKIQVANEIINKQLINNRLMNAANSFLNGATKNVLSDVSKFIL